MATRLVFLLVLARFKQPLAALLQLPAGSKQCLSALSGPALQHQAKLASHCQQHSSAWVCSIVFTRPLPSSFNPWADPELQDLWQSEASAGFGYLSFAYFQKLSQSPHQSASAAFELLAKT